MEMSVTAMNPRTFMEGMVSFHGSEGDFHGSYRICQIIQEARRTTVARRGDYMHVPCLASRWTYLDYCKQK